MAPGTSPPTIAIIGSGIGGLALAIGLLKQNVAITICKFFQRQYTSPFGCHLTKINSTYSNALTDQLSFKTKEHQDSMRSVLELVLDLMH